MKKSISLTIVIAILLNLVGCSSKIESKNNNPSEEKSITVVYFENWNYETKIGKYYAKMAYECNDAYYRYFRDRTGIEVKTKFINYESDKDIMYQVNTKGRTGELGDLIFVKTNNLEEELDMTKWAQKIIKSGAVEDIRDKVLKGKNAKKNITKTAFIPVSMDFKMKPIHNEIVKEFNLNTNEIITKSEELDMLKKIMGDKEIPICSEIIDREIFYEEDDYYWIENGKIKFDKNKLKENVKRIEARFNSGKYNLDKLYELDFEDIQENYINYNREKEIELIEEFQVDNRVSKPFERFEILTTGSSKYKIENYIKGYNCELKQKTIVPIEEMDLRLVLDDDTGKEGYLLLKSSNKKEESVELLKYLTSIDGQATIMGKQRRMPILNIDEKILDLALTEAQGSSLDIVYLPNQREMIKKMDKFISENLYEKYENLSKEGVTVKSLMRKDLYEIKIKMMFDKTYTEEKLDEDVDKMLNEVNLKLSEIL